MLLSDNINHSLQQRGAVLIISLLVMLVMTLIGVTAMQVTSLEENMVANVHDRGLAFQASETALRVAEKSLEMMAVVPTFTCVNGYFQADDINCDGAREAASIWDVIDWNSIDVMTYSGPTLVDVAANPSYIVEYLQPAPDPGGSLSPGPIQFEYFRITAHGIGGTPNAVAIVQSTYKW